MRRILRYVVFERTMGAKSWTIAFKSQNSGDLELPAMFHSLALARAFVRNVHSKRLGWWGGIPDQRPMESNIVKCVLPA